MGQFLGLEITEKTLRYVACEKSPRHCRVIKTGKVEVAEDFFREGILSGQIKQVLAEEKLRPSHIFLTLSLKDTFIRQTVIPAVSQKELSEVVSSEIEKVLSFNQRGYDCAFSRDHSGKDKLKVIFAAVFNDALQAIHREIGRLKTPGRNLSISGLDIPGVISLIPPVRRDDVVLLINDQFSQLLILENKRINFYYKFSLGIAQLTNPANARIAEQTIITWESEINRVLRGYISENKQATLDRIWIVGDFAAIPDFVPHLENSLGIKVEDLLLSRIPGMEVSDKAQDKSAFLPALTPIILYLHHLKPLFPPDHFFRDFQTANHLRRRIIGAVLYAGIAAGVFGILNTDMTRRIEQQNAKTQTLDIEITKLEHQVKDLNEVEAAYQLIRNRLLEQATYVQALNRVPWSQVFSVFAKELPASVSLSDFKFMESGMAQIEGEAVNMESVAEMIRRIDTSAILENGKFNSLRENLVKKTKVYYFGISANLKKPEVVKK